MFNFETTPSAEVTTADSESTQTAEKMALMLEVVHSGSRWRSSSHDWNWFSYRGNGKETDKTKGFYCPSNGRGDDHPLLGEDDRRGRAASS